jgi:hypothetical protein
MTERGETAEIYFFGLVMFMKYFELKTLCNLLLARTASPLLQGAGAPRAPLIGKQRQHRPSPMLQGAGAPRAPLTHVGVTGWEEKEDKSAQRGGVTRQGVARTDLQSLLDGQ